jgi:hypothetical protein
MIKEFNGKKYIFISHDIKVSYACPKCVAWNKTDLCNALSDDCDDGYFSEADDRTPEVTDNQEQMTLRDQFAMATINGLVASKTYSTEHGAEFAARTAYAFADAMMKERAK